MGNKLWFLSEDNEPIAVFDSKIQALEEKESLAYENEDATYKVYGLTPEDLEDNSDEYEQEYDLALQEGFV